MKSLPKCVERLEIEPIINGKSIESVEIEEEVKRGTCIHGVYQRIAALQAAQDAKIAELRSNMTKTQRNTERLKNFVKDGSSRVTTEQRVLMLQRQLDIEQQEIARLERTNLLAQCNAKANVEDYIVGMALDDGLRMVDEKLWFFKAERPAESKEQHTCIRAKLGGNACAVPDYRTVNDAFGIDNRKDLMRSMRSTLSYILAVMARSQVLAQTYPLYSQVNAQKTLVGSIMESLDGLGFVQVAKASSLNMELVIQEMDAEKRNLPLFKMFTPRIFEECVPR